MITRFTVKVLDPIGLHARPAGQLVKLVNESGLVVKIGKLGQELVQANSPLRVMALKAKSQDELALVIEADDEAMAKDLASRIQQILKEL